MSILQWIKITLHVIHGCNVVEASLKTKFITSLMQVHSLTNKVHHKINTTH
jgi:hypothetical protein